MVRLASEHRADWVCVCVCVFWVIVHQLVAQWQQLRKHLAGCLWGGGWERIARATCKTDSWMVAGGDMTAPHTTVLPTVASVTTTTACSVTLR